MALDKHLKEIEASIEELKALSPALTATTSLQHGYLGTFVDNMIALLRCAADNRWGWSADQVFQ